MTEDMQLEQNIINAKLVLLQNEIRLQGMIAENMQRDHAGYCMAYVEDDFLKLIEEVNHNNIVSILNAR